ncbi:MAG: polysaccharide deacetylase family protein [bacterium]|nr:polysaccharide deacetylase family protein [bacterium]
MTRRAIPAAVVFVSLILTALPPTVPTLPVVAEAKIDAAETPSEEARVAVLIYHDVHPEPYNEYCVTPERLAGDLRWFLGQGWQPLTLAEFALWMAGDLELSGDCMLLTFDDGYLGWAEHGYPVLRALEVPAVQFLLTGRLGRPGGVDGPPAISAAQVVAVAAEGLVTFADHTHDLHREVDGKPLVMKVSVDVVAKDLDTSRSILSGLTGAVPVALAWPYGASTPAAAAAAADRYDLVFLAVDGFAGRGEPQGIPRFAIDWRDPAELPGLFPPR